MDGAAKIPEFMQYGAMGILAAAFIVMLLLWVRSDKRSQQYADRLAEASFDRSALISVVQENTKANTALAAQIAGMGQAQERAATIMNALERRLVDFKCPLQTPKE